jgi:hypothetical protein
MRAAARQIAAGHGADAGDFVLRGDRPVREIAEDLLARLGWAG